MKKLIALFTALAFAVTLGTAFAEEKAPAAGEKAPATSEKAPAKAKKAKKTAHTKKHSHKAAEAAPAK